MKAVVLSDLHLEASGDSETGDAFVSFLDWLVTRAQTDNAPWRLIVLGDFLDLLHAPPGLADPSGALEAVAAQHHSALAALGAAAVSGIQVDLVPGNHDSEFLDPSLQQQLRALVADASGTNVAGLSTTFKVRPWFVLVPGTFYAEHGSQYHSLNAVADPLNPFGRWSRRLPPGAILDLGLRDVQDGARVRALPRLLPAVLRAAAARRETDAATTTALQAYAQEVGLSSGSLAALRDLGEDSPLALARNLSAALLRRTRYVESRQQQAALAVQQILAHEQQATPLYVFGHTHRLAHCEVPAGDNWLLWLNPGAWVDGVFGFAQVEDRTDRVVARLWRWDAVTRSALAMSDPLVSPRSAQEGEPARRARKAGSGSADPVATP